MTTTLTDLEKELLDALKEMLREYRAAERFIDHAYGKIPNDTLYRVERKIANAEGGTP